MDPDRAPGRPGAMSAVLGRFVRVWRGLAPERRLAAGAAGGMFLTLFLPWYQETVIVTGKSGALHDQSAPLTGWAAFSFVEAAVLLVAAGVLTLLFQRGEGRAFHLPGGDGWIITLAGAWTCVLVVWRIFDKQTTHISGPGVTASGVEWGIFAALGIAGLLTYAGSRIRAAGAPEPPLPEDEVEFTLPRRSRRPGEQTTRPVRFPTPEPLADPPTLRFGTGGGDNVAGRPPPEPTRATEATDAPTRSDEQLTIPFEDLGR